MVTDTSDPAVANLEQLLGYLALDPANPALLADAAEAAIDARRPADALDLLDRAAVIVPPGPRERNLAGLAAIHAGRFDMAADAFGAMIAQGGDDPALRYNLAWSRTMLGDEAGALDVLDDAAARALPQAAALRVQLLHSAGRLDEGVERGRSYLLLYPGDRALAAAMSVLAIDTGDETLAADCAAQAPDHPDALTTLGTLALGRDNATAAQDLFDRALARNSGAPRAWIGRGLASLLAGQPDRAPGDIDRGAEMFGTHLGSWIAAGWSHFINGDLNNSRARFERALAIDATFAETHGSLAVLDMLAGDSDAARERVEIALRLDRQCYSAALALALLAAAGGDAARSRAIVERALHTPIDGSGRTIGQSLTRMGLEASAKN
ncbi:tetratricopeptide repeat protein [uncultured Sphingomonas sp.]|uniref:tetratricopeptide repeat protein n=1 Tax=uncultured Sphingomonas sp. TaxID=158754 RepID=UPI0035CB3A40